MKIQVKVHTYIHMDIIKAYNAPQHTHASCINQQRSCCFALFIHRMPCNFSPALLDSFPCPCQSETLCRPLNTCKALSRDKTLTVLLLYWWLKTRFFFSFLQYQFIVNCENGESYIDGANVWPANICRCVAIFYLLITLDCSCSKAPLVVCRV